MKPKKVSGKAIRKIIDTRTPFGLFYAKEGRFYVGVDNRSGDAWTEEFLTKRVCLQWLKGEE